MPIWVVAVILATIGATLLLSAVLWRLNASNSEQSRRQAGSGDGGVYAGSYAGGAGGSGRDNDRSDMNDSGGGGADAGGGDGGGGGD